MIDSIMDKVVSDYSRLNFNEIMDLPFSRYLKLRRDGFIYRLSQTKAGQDYLENCWILEQTKPDRKRLRERFGKEDSSGGQH